MPPTPLTIVNQLGPGIGDRLRAALPDHNVVDQAWNQGAPLPPEATVLFAAPKIPAGDDGSVNTGWAAQLDWIHVASAGIDGIPPALLTSRLATCGRGIQAAPIADWVLAVMLARKRGIPKVWVHEPTTDVGPLIEGLGAVGGTTLGLIGFGEIGRAVAERALPFGYRVLATRRSIAPSAVDGVTTAPLDYVLSQSDVLVVAAPATAHTRGLLDADTLALVKPGVHLINVARGELIDHEALAAALESGVVGYATLDATEPEPLPAGHPFYSHPAVDISPHISWADPRTIPGTIDRFVDNVQSYLRSEPLLGVVDPAKGY
ncbi:NAD(P)-dependent oxidoreductase [Rhodococcus globerulus]|uniref:NAD(P)-dependent oxidoreductase n=1 Tax=Rhodococcus globerulus TaxID=33008 RepID=A0ABU4C491_RHOGO|nr:NAD(P)-dependent oxidoreductase [Rhodococcus globerulus]MDV6271203.1 NAD(P)-dependent oxidoreductase [Rhodococcus globerulus]